MHPFTAVTLCLQNKEEQDLVEVCRRLMANMHDGNCTLVWQQRNDKIHFDYVEINGKGKGLEKDVSRFSFPRTHQSCFHSENQTGSRVL